MSIMEAARAARGRVDDWSDAKKDYAERVVRSRPVDIKPDGAFISEAQRCDYPDDEAGNLPLSEWSPTIGQPKAANSDTVTVNIDGAVWSDHRKWLVDSGDCIAKFQPVVANDNYTTLRTILDAAFNHAATGKGKERHARDLPFDDQPIMQTTRLVGVGFPLGQSIKKAGEAAGMIERGQMDMAEVECLGAINYLAGAVAWMREQVKEGKVANRE